jgi:hypothetical protein
VLFQEFQQADNCDLKAHYRDALRKNLGRVARREPIQCWPLTLGAEMRRHEFISLLLGGWVAARNASAAADDASNRAARSEIA